LSSVIKDEKFNYLFHLLIEFDKYCCNHDIDVMLDRGTLLGAIRHRGFIPWDYDLDVSMTWANYQKLLDAWKHDPLPGREIVNWELYPDYPSFFLRYIDKTTTEIRRASAWDVAPAGMSLDVFILIPLPVDTEEAKLAQDSYIVYFELMDRIKLNKRTREKSVLKLMKSCLQEIEQKDNRLEVCERLKAQMLKGVSDPDYTHYFLTPIGIRKLCIYDRSDADEFTTIQFEGRFFKAPLDYYHVIRKEYGPGWRYFPAKADSYPYIENLNIPYSIYMHDYMQYFEKQQILSDYAALKDAELQDLLVHQEASSTIYMLELEVFLARFASFGKANAYNLENLPEELGTLFNEYISYQISAKPRYWNLWSGLDDSWLEMLLQKLLNKAEYLKASALLDLRVGASTKPLSQAVQTKQIRLNRVFDLATAEDCKDVALVIELLNEIDSLDPLISSSAVADAARLFLIAEEAEKTGDYAALKMKAEAALKRFPESPEIMFFLALANRRCGNEADAIVLVKQIRKTSNNGTLLLRIDDEWGDLL